MNRSILVTIAVISLGVAAIVALVPDRAPRETTVGRADWLSNDSTLVAERQLLQERNTELRRLESRITRIEARRKAAALPRPGARIAYRLSDDLEPETAARFAAKLDAEFASLGPAPRGRVLVQVEWNSRSRALSVTRRLTVLPLEGESDSTCVEIVEASAFRRFRGSAAVDERVLGICGFVASFGLPGRGVRAWLDSTGGRGAQVDLAPPPSGLWASNDELDAMIRGRYPTVFGCRAGREAACERLLATANEEFAWLRVEPPTNDAEAGVYHGRTGYTGGDFPDALLADLRAAMGDDRFRDLWQSDRSPLEAYYRIMGVSPAAAIQARIVADVPQRPPGPMPNAGGPLGAVLISAGAAVWAIRRTKRRTV